ncbi:MAG: arsenate reductase (glutaredoxin) [Candidatus Hydrogenedentes bacterium]|nr:arsenate reductase (glutaredoxin) [Candidatus Hydrogenedentota bacterium]
MKPVTIYHNPRCSKSRETLALLKKNNVEPEIIEYLSTPPNKAQLRQLAGMVKGGAPALLRTKEGLSKTLGLSASSPAAKIIDAIAEHPILLERPLVVCGDKAAIGRPPEAVLGIL